MKFKLIIKITALFSIISFWSCADPVSEKEIILGCTYISACNYDETATDDDGSCTSNYSEIPANTTIQAGDSCLADSDIQALADLIEMNNLEEETPLHLGYQTWMNGRLRFLLAYMNPGQYPAGIETPIDTLPESIGNLTELRILNLQWNNIRHLPESFNQLVNLTSLSISNNSLQSIIPDIDSLSQLYTLDLGYNQISSIPESISNLSNLTYLYLFNNSLTSLPQGICNLDLDWSGNDNNWLPFFAIGGNQLCENIPDCAANSENFEISLEQFYYSFPIDAPQECDGL